MTEPPKIYQAISEMASEVPAIAKKRKTTSGSIYNYRGVDDIFNVVHPLLKKHKVFLVPKVLDEQREERTSKNGALMTYTRLKVEYTFFAEDGSSVQATVLGEAMDTSDKASTKAQSVAYRIVLIQMLSIPTEEMVDPETHDHQLRGSDPQLEGRARTAILATATIEALDKCQAQVAKYVKEGRLDEAARNRLSQDIDERREALEGQS